MGELIAVNACHREEPSGGEERVTDTSLTGPRENLLPNLSLGPEIGPSEPGSQKKPITFTLNWLGLGIHKMEKYTKIGAGGGQ